LKPENHRMLPQQKFSRADGSRSINNLAIFGIRPVKTYPYVRPRIPDFRGSIIVKRIIAWPFVVGVRGEIARLTEQVRFSVFPNHKNHIALGARTFIVAGEFTQINAAWPILRNRKRHAFFPSAFAEPLHRHHGHWLRTSLERT